MVIETIKSQTIEEGMLPRIGVTITECIQKTIKDIPQEILVLFFYSKVMQLLSIDRVRLKSVHVEDGLESVPLNMYAIVFMNSGSGKDRSINMINKVLFANVWKDFYGRYMTRMEGVREDLRQEAEDKYPGASKAKVNEYIREHEPHELRREISSGTPESIMAYRNSFNRIGLGGIYLRNSEFADYFENYDEKKMDFLSLIKESFDGELLGKALKTEKQADVVGDTPVNFLAYTSKFAFVEREDVRNRLYKLLGRGFARRAFICLDPSPPDFSEEQLSAKESLKLKKTLNTEQQLVITQVQDWLQQLYEANKQNSNILNYYTLDSDCEELVEEYELYTKRQLKEASARKFPEHIVSEIKGRVWRTMRLAGAIGAFEHPLDRFIHHEDMQFAILLSENYVETYNRFFLKTEKLPHELLFDFLADNKGKWFSITDIRKLRLVADREFKSWFIDQPVMLNSLTFGSNFKLEEMNLGTNGKQYRFMAKDDDTALTERIRKTTGITVKDDDSPGDLT